MSFKDHKTEERILEAAKTVFMRDGLYGARMQDIADTAGINKALLHYYFRNKEKLFDQVFEGVLERYFENMDVLADESLPVIERIHTYVDKIFDFLREYPQMSMFIIKEISTNEELFKAKVQKLKKSKNASLIYILNEGIRTNEIALVNPALFLFNLHSLCFYPFLASPIFKAIIEHSNSTFEDPNNEKLKSSVKDFVTHKLSLHHQ
jgi:AcrR family transcriptional regulator